MLIYQSLLSLIALFFGSLAGVLIKRIPKNENLIFSRSQCPDCGHQLTWYENIPVISFIFLLGKCSNCKTKISSFYPLVEIGFLICAFPFVTIAAKRFMILANSGVLNLALILLDFLFHMSFIALAFALGLIDHKSKTLPHKLTYSGILLGIIYVSFFASPYYELSTGFVERFEFIPGILLSSFSAIKQFAIIAFTLDITVYLINSVVFRKNALLDPSYALCFGQKKLMESAKLIYLIYALLILFLIYLGQSLFLELFFILVGILYLVFEIFPYLFGLNHFASAPMTKEASAVMTNNEATKTILGGGDIMMLAFFATILGFQKSTLVFLASFYVAFIFLLFKIIVAYFKFQMTDKNLDQDNPTKGFDIKSFFSGTIPLGLALALSFIAVMMMLAH